MAWVNEREKMGGWVYDKEAAPPTQRAREGVGVEVGPDDWLDGVVWCGCSLIAEMQQAEAVSREWDRVELRVYDISQGYADMLGAVVREG